MQQRTLQSVQGFTLRVPSQRLFCPHPQSFFISHRERAGEGRGAGEQETIGRKEEGIVLL